ncbi:nucleotidyl transferase AbiEii/AbiGii toxin family protein [Acidobacteriota bacterium]
MIDSKYFNQAKVLLEILPLLQKEGVFALKGGTAINFFIRDLPRLSVDIDLTYLPINERDIAFNDISRSLINLKKRIEKQSPNTHIILKKHRDIKLVKGLILNRAGSIVKIEPNLVMRGSVFEPEIRSISEKTQDLFELYVEAKLLSLADLYGGKICATLDRQHPRDLFDIHLLLKNEGITEPIKKAFIVYLISHPRPIVEILNPTFIDIQDVYEKEFTGMSEDSINQRELEEIRKFLVSSINKSLDNNDKKFIISVKQGKPAWDLLEIPGLEKLPAVKWKLLNIKKIPKIKHEAALNKLRDHLGM